jgi:hypothetical protein
VPLTQILSRHFCNSSRVRLIGWDCVSYVLLAEMIEQIETRPDFAPLILAQCRTSVATFSATAVVFSKLREYLSANLVSF